MKTREPPAKLLILLLLTGGTLCSWSQSTIAYSAGPAFQTPAGFLPVSFDLDQDGSADFGFMDSGPLCTTDVPCSLCTLSFDVLILGTNGLLVQGSYAAILPAGEWIGPVTSSNGVWSSAGNSTLLSLWWSERYGTSGSTGPLATMGEGFLGARFYGADGLHYGWVHVRLALVAPVVVDWAYETRPGVPIQAGAGAARLADGRAARLLAAELAVGDRQGVSGASEGASGGVCLDEFELRHPRHHQEHNARSPDERSGAVFPGGGGGLRRRRARALDTDTSDWRRGFHWVVQAMETHGLRAVEPTAAPLCSSMVAGFDDTLCLSGVTSVTKGGAAVAHLDRCPVSCGQVRGQGGRKPVRPGRA